MRRRQDPRSRPGGHRRRPRKDHCWHTDKSLLTRSILGAASTVHLADRDSWFPINCCYGDCDIIGFVENGQFHVGHRLRDNLFFVELFHNATVRSVTGERIVV